MILADTSVWVDHLSSRDTGMQALLIDGRILMHPLVVAELALGSLRDRNKTLSWLQNLPCATTANLEEVRQMIEARALYGQGIGLIDAQLLASVLLTPSTLLWTRDKALRRAAAALHLHADLP